MQGANTSKIKIDFEYPWSGPDRVPAIKKSTVPQKYDVMIQYGGLHSNNNQEARSAKNILVKSKTVLLIDVLENKVISCDMIVFDLAFIYCLLVYD